MSASRPLLAVAISLPLQELAVGPAPPDPRFAPMPRRYNMRTFWEWHHYKMKKPGPVMPQADRVLHLIQQAGRRGISYGRLAAAITLEKQTFDSVVAALIRFNQASVSMENGQRIYRA